ncbi:threonine synthase [Temperatibacter marinus]|uniref:Threonine synthase n=1 Tax=Temperatibacter marinus TaxID=1456591 RepID=A0AA52EIZ4_9PROT|nr:threonine synthase [Temperatibacter marinus]WND02906.1 threonine synthase [Temperatibacter marinus]
MKYISTRGQESDDRLSFEDVTLAGLARDGGLYVPEYWPILEADDIANLAGLSYAEVAVKVLYPFVEGSLSESELRTVAEETYGPQFAHAAVAPVKQLSHNEYLLELFHGPTLAFKDFALQMLGRLFDIFTARQNREICILGATSGDTGSAAIEATRGRDTVSIFMLHPEGRVSEVQRRQMTTVIEPNVINLAVKGTFDDCQALVKESFNDLTFRDNINLTAVNSINWARVMAQVVYYFTTAVSLGAPHRKVSFVVPTGNFGDIFAGFVAHKMGLPIEKLIIATNSNDILAKTLQTGRYAKGQVKPTLSPSMDIQVSSNFERLLFELTGRKGKDVAERLTQFSDLGYFDLEDSELEAFRELFDARQITDEETSDLMKEMLCETGELIDPHTAVGVGASRVCLQDSNAPIVILATAHPAKFGDAVENATGTDPELPAKMADLMDRDEGYGVIENNGPALREMMQKFRESK